MSLLQLRGDEAVVALGELAGVVAGAHTPSAIPRRVAEVLAATLNPIRVELNLDEEVFWWQKAGAKVRGNPLRLAARHGGKEVGSLRLWLGAEVALGPATEVAMGKVLGAAVSHARLLSRVAALSKRAHAENRELRGELRRAAPGDEIAAVSQAMREILDEQVPLVARQETTVLIRGESGTGKELIARRIHALSGRAGRPFVKVNCGAIPEGLLESELFGHEKGSFTGAMARHEGVFERASGGTLLLDEVGELPLSAQVKLLRVLQERAFERVGGSETLTTSARILAATHRDLEGMVRDERFRGDLYYRLDVFPIWVPPLRERPEDIPPLVASLLARVCRRMGRRPPTPGPADIERLGRHPWPGNVRELENLLERAVVLSPGDTLRLPSDLGRAALRPSRPPTLLREAVKQSIEEALAACGGKIYGPGGAAERLGLRPTTLQSKMLRLGIQRARRGPP